MDSGRRMVRHGNQSLVVRDFLEFPAIFLRGFPWGSARIPGELPKNLRLKGLFKWNQYAENQLKMQMLST